MRRSVLSVAVVVITALVVGLFAASTPSRAQANARVNILHLAPFAPTIDGTAVTVVVNGSSIASDFKYKDAPLTANLPSGDYTVEVFAGTDLEVAPAITATLSLAAGGDYTVFAGGGANGIPLGLFPLVDDNTLPEAPNAHVRVVHAAPFAAQAATAVDVRNALTDEVIGGLTGVEFGAASGYLPVPGDTDIPVKVVPTSDPMADPPIIGPANLNVPAQSITTVFAVGTGTDTYPAEFFFLGGAQRVPAQVRLAHLAPFAGGRAAVNVVVPGDTPVTLVSDFGFGDTTDYVPLTDGTYPINVVIPSAPRALADTVAISGSVTLAPGMRYTAMAIGGANGFAPELVLLNDPITPPITDTARVRIYHAAPFAPGEGANVSIRTQDGAVVGGLDNVPYKGTATLELPAGVYDLLIATPDGATTLLDIPAFVLAAGDDITVFAVGDGVNQDVGLVVLPRDGIVPPAEVRLAHLAPFAGGRAAVNVVVPVDPPVALATDFGFGDTTDFLQLPGGTYPINVVIPSAPRALADTVAISGSVTLAPGMRYTAMAIGGANGFAPELVLLNDPITPPITDTARVRIYHAAPFAPGDAANVSIRTQDGAVVGGLDNVPYKGTATLELPAGVYDLLIATPDGATTLLDIPAFVLAAGDDITVFAVGDGVNQDVGLVVLPRDGIVPPAEVRLAHLAPFAGGRAAVNVVVPTVPPVTLASDFGFGETTGFLQLPGGTYPINVVIPRTPASLADTVAISGSVTLAPGMRYTAIAIGGANGFAPELVLLNDPTDPPAAGTARVRIYHAAPFAAGEEANVSIRLQDGTVVPGLGNVPYKGTATFPLPPGTYDLIIATPDGATTLLDLPPFTLVAGDDITVFAVGDGENQDVGTVVLGLRESERFKVYLPFVAN